MIIVTDEQFFLPFLEIQQQKKKVETKLLLHFCLTKLDWLRSDPDEKNGGWLLGSIQSEMWTHEREHTKKNKRGVVCILSLFIIEKEERERG